MAFFIGNIIGCALIIWIFTYPIFKFGTKNIKINFALQLAVAILLTYLETSTYKEINDSVIASYIGFVITMGIMLVLIIKKKTTK